MTRAILRNYGHDDAGVQRSGAPRRVRRRPGISHRDGELHQRGAGTSGKRRASVFRWLFKSNARNHIDPDTRFGISEAAGAFTAFPKEAGLAAAALGEEAVRTGKTPANGDMSVIRDFARVMGAEWRSVGLRGMYGYMADLGTEPRWFRIQETFTENADLAANIIRTLVQTLQGEAVRDGTSVTPASAVALTVKHFPGGGPQEDGLDPHYTFGKQQVYGSEAGFAYHLKPFRAAIEAGVSAIMPYYGVPTAGRDANGEPVSLTYEGVVYGQTGFAFSKQIVSDLLRAKARLPGLRQLRHRHHQ